MELRFFELRVSRTDTEGVYNLFAASDHHGADEAVAVIEPSAPPFETLSSLLARPLTLQDLRALGTALFESLFVAQVGEVLEEALREVLGSEGLGLRIILRIEAPELAVLPWEMLFHPRREIFLASASKVFLSRTLTLVGTIRSMTLPPQARALVVMPDSGLDTKLERTETERLLRQVLAVDGVSARVTRAALRDKLQEAEYHLVHFSGHGDFRGGEAMIFLDGERGRPDPVPAQVFADFFLHYDSVRLILLNACRGAMRSNEAFAGLTPELLRRGVPAVIAMQSSITNSEATRFTTAFYQSLIRGLQAGNVDVALARARGALLQDGFYDSQLISPIFASPVLYLRAQESQLWRQDMPNLLEQSADHLQKSLQEGSWSSGDIVPIEAGRLRLERDVSQIRELDERVRETWEKWLKPSVKLSEALNKGAARANRSWFRNAKLQNYYNLYLEVRTLADQAVDANSEVTAVESNFYTLVGDLIDSNYGAGTGHEKRAGLLATKAIMQEMIDGMARFSALTDLGTFHLLFEDLMPQLMSQVLMRQDGIEILTTKNKIGIWLQQLEGTLKTAVSTRRMLIYRCDIAYNKLTD